MMLEGGRMVEAVELFTIDELKELNIMQLRRVCAYLGIDFSVTSDKNKASERVEKSRLMNKILEFQKPKSYWDGNPDWEPGRERSARVQRLYELNTLGKKLGDYNGV